jgi:two-component system cell cycle sensor histidine kinase/response regulator CckA
MSTALRVLIVEDSPDDALLTVRALQRGNYEVKFDRVDGEHTMRRALTEREWDLVISDWSMPGFGALRALAIARELVPTVPVILVSGTVGEETAIEALQAGARDFVLKGRLTRLVPAVERELRESATHKLATQKLRSVEEQLQHAQKMEAVGRLAGGVAHDFNNMLTVVLSYADLLLADLADDDPMRADLGEIKKAGIGASNLTRQLLAFSRRQVLQPVALDLNRVVQGMSSMLRRLLGADVELSVMGDSGLWMVRADAGQIEQVVMNLAVNARDAMPAGGVLTVEAKNAVLTDEDARDHLGVTPGRYVMLAISDTGIGMDRDTQARIFEPFFTTKDQGKGTGLGLSTVFGIVAQSDGHIWVDSEPNQGTTFKIFFPKADKTSRTTSAPPPISSSPAGSETVLLVENDEQVRTVAREILRRHGYHVLVASSPGDAIVVCEQHIGKIHLLLTDVILPRMSGRVLADRLRSMQPEMRVLFMSGYTGDESMISSELDSDAAFLPKPLTPQSLTRKLREVLRMPSTSTE